MTALLISFAGYRESGIGVHVGVGGTLVGVSDASGTVVGVSTGVGIGVNCGIPLQSPVTIP